MMTPHAIIQGHLKTIAFTHRDSVKGILSADKHPNLVGARREAILTLHKRFGWGGSKLGRILHKDHSTVSRIIKEGKEE